MLCLCVASLALAFGNVNSAHSSSSTVEVSINIENIENLYGCSLKLSYNTASFDLINAIPEPPWATSLVVKSDNEEANGIYTLAVAAIAPEPPFSGSTELAKLVFVRTGEGEVDCYVSEAQLADQYGNPIPFEINGCTIEGLPTHNVAVVDVIAKPRSAYQGDPIQVDVVAQNLGNFPETFSITVFADRDGTIIGDEIVVGKTTISDMLPQTIQTVGLTWDTTGAPYGTYWLSAKADCVAGETETNDNFLKIADRVGGIYPRPAVRQTADMLAQVVSVLSSVSIAAVGLVGVKKYFLD